MTATHSFPVRMTLDEALSLLARDGLVTIGPLSDAQVEALLRRDAAAEAVNDPND